jgi:hypothetical protein
MQSSQSPATWRAAAIARSRTVRVAAAAVALAAAVAIGCPAAGAAVSTARAGGQLSAAELRAALLTAANLPGYKSYKFSSADEPTGSNKPACLHALNDLGAAPVAPRGVTQAYVGFAQSTAGPWLEEILRSYPGASAVGAFSGIVSVLGACGTLTLVWGAPAPATGSETVRALGSIALGSQSWSAEIVIGIVPDQTVEFLDLVRVGGVLAVIALGETFYAVTAAKTKTLTVKALAKLRAAEAR